MIDLNKSETYVSCYDDTGICLTCGEHAGVLEGCCGSGVDFEGGSVHRDDLISDIAHELDVTEDEVSNELD